jgi:hypothetical protein
MISVLKALKPKAPGGFSLHIFPAAPVERSTPALEEGIGGFPDDRTFASMQAAYRARGVSRVQTISTD